MQSKWLLLILLQISSGAYGQKSPGIQQLDNAPNLAPVQDSQKHPVDSSGSSIMASEFPSQAVAPIKSEDFNKGFLHNPLQLVQGKTAGLQITKPGGDPHGFITARIRGLSSRNASTEPLVVIDGFVGASLESIDPADIAAVTILKDAAAASIYGARGAAGVIIITSKTGKGKASVNYNTSLGFDKLAKKIETLPLAQYRSLNNVTDYGASPDWYDLITRSAATQVHNLSFSGATSGTSYRASVNLRDAEGIQRNSGFLQWNGRLSLSQKALRDKATFTLDLAGTTRTNEFGEPEAFRYATVVNPTMPVYNDEVDEYGGYYQLNFFQHFNPLAIVEQNKREGKSQSGVFKTGVEYNLTDLAPGLRVLINYYHQIEQQTNGSYSSRYAFYGGGFNRKGLANLAMDESKNNYLEAQLDYQKTLGDLSVYGTASYSYQYFLDNGFNLTTGNFITDAFSYNNIGASLDLTDGLATADSYTASYKMISFAGRAHLSYKKTYFLSAGSNYNGSSRFGMNGKWGNYPHLAAAIEVSHLFDLPLIDKLAVRYSWGKAGNIPTASYTSLKRFDFDRAYPINGVFRPSTFVSSAGNPDLKSEVKTENNFGIDFSTNDNKFYGSLEWFTNRISDLISVINLPSPPSESSQKLANGGEIENKGFELSLFYDPIKTSHFSWNTGINLSKVTSRLIEFADNQANVADGQLLSGSLWIGCSCYGIVRTKQGEEMGQLYGLVSTGRVDDNGNDTFTDFTGNDCVECLENFRTIGNAYPNLTLGFNNNFSYRSFSMNLFFRSALGHSLVNSYRTLYESTGLAANYNVVATKHYDPRLMNSRFSSRTVENASYLKLDNVTLGYDYPMKNVEFFRQITFYVTAQNLFTITGYTGFDPEVRYSFVDFNGNREVLAPGIEEGNIYPSTRTFLAGVNLQF